MLANDGIGLPSAPPSAVTSAVRAAVSRDVRRRVLDVTLPPFRRNNTDTVAIGASRTSRYTNLGAPPAYRVRLSATSLTPIL
jgi:hypothetical protein